MTTRTWTVRKEAMIPTDWHTKNVSMWFLICALVTNQPLFGREKDDSFKGSIGNIYQSFGGQDLYLSLEEKAAHLLYFITKNHSFLDGNKRIAATMFLYFLDKTAYCLQTAVNLLTTTHWLLLPLWLPSQSRRKRNDDYSSYELSGIIHPKGQASRTLQTCLRFLHMHRTTASAISKDARFVCPMYFRMPALLSIKPAKDLNLHTKTGHRG